VHRDDDRKIIVKKVLISGARGFVGTPLAAALREDGYAVTALSRREGGSGVVSWDPAAGRLAPEDVTGFDAVVHLAGEGIATGRWTTKRKRLIRDSRVGGTRLLCETLAAASALPSVFICASAIGYYGDRGSEELSEESAAGKGFLAEVCRDWEAETVRLAEAGVRVVNARIGVILGRTGGALQRMLLPFRLGLGGVIGDGNQVMSWIAVEDVVNAIRFAVATEALCGPVNLTAPSPVANRSFTKSLGRALARPTVFPMPAFVARIAFGEMADELLLSSAHVLPRKLLSAGFTFSHAELDDALRAVLAD